MGVYRQLRSPYWWVRVPRPGLSPIRESTRVLIDAPTRDQRQRQRHLAEQIYADRVSNLARERHEIATDKPAIAFKKFAAWYRAHKVVRHRGEEREREMLAKLEDFFGGYHLAAITTKLVEEYLTKRTNADKRTASTANREVDLLKTMMVAAVPTYLPSSPIAGMRRLRKVPRRKRVLEPKEEELVLAALDKRDRALFIAGADTLVRLGDLLDLRREDDHGDYLQIVDSKTGPYEVPVSSRLRAALDTLEPAPHGDYYFWWRRRAATARDRRSVVRKIFRQACEAAGVPYGRMNGGVTWHTGTRASGATRMLRAGADPATVQAVGHWASLEQMGNYLQTNRERMKAAVELVGQYAQSMSAPPRKGADRRGKMRKLRTRSDKKKARASGPNSQNH